MDHLSPTKLSLIAVLAAIILYALLSRRIGRSILTLPMLFAAFGFLISAPLHNITSPELMHEGKAVLAEVTLILVLFSDASHVRFKRLEATWGLPARMLIIGMPLTVGLGTLVAYAIDPAAGIGVALLTAAVLTPTDAALGQSVVSSPDVPNHLSQSINVESGLNDGLALPFVLLGAVLAADLGAEAIADLPALIALQLILGPLVGIAVGGGVARLMNLAQEHEAIEEVAGGLVFMGSAFLAYLLAEITGGNGFIAAFVAGMVFGNSYRHEIHFISEFMEGMGQILVMLAFLTYGAFLLPSALSHLSWRVVLLAVAFLTIVRMLPIWLSLIGTGLSARDKLFLGWFGPRGLASILFTLLMIERFDLPGEEAFMDTVTLCVGFSILLHGFSAAPLARLMGRRP